MGHCKNYKKKLKVEIIKSKIKIAKSHKKNENKRGIKTSSNSTATSIFNALEQERQFIIGKTKSCSKENFWWKNKR